jgi:cytochrome c-type biogenesis protein CcmH/NrfF
MALFLPPVLLGVLLWLVPTVIVLVVLGVTRALDHRRSVPAAPARGERTAMRPGIPAP